MRKVSSLFPCFISFSMTGFSQVRTADRSPVYNDTLTRYFTTQHRKRNPVITQLTPNDNL
ncbi:hypothetical protein [Chitinophaga sp. RAB17]|uniref:hypothetical protein n=1 Tax=Chitinophaga sp. RAB17 TaxID=3233049 RepID=UPI003F9054E1